MHILQQEYPIKKLCKRRQSESAGQNRHEIEGETSGCKMKLSLLLRIGWGKKKHIIPTHVSEKSGISVVPRKEQQDLVAGCGGSGGSAGRQWEDCV